MRVLIDTNIAITYLTRRSDPYPEESDRILLMCAKGEIEGAIALHSLSTIGTLRGSRSLPRSF